MSESHLQFYAFESCGGRNCGLIVEIEGEAQETAGVHGLLALSQKIRGMVGNAPFHILFEFRTYMEA